jgi:hypothetical protein
MHDGLAGKFRLWRHCGDDMMARAQAIAGGGAVVGQAPPGEMKGNHVDTNYAGLFERILTAMVGGEPHKASVRKREPVSRASGAEPDAWSGDAQARPSSSEAPSG